MYDSRGGGVHSYAAVEDCKISFRIQPALSVDQGRQAGACELCTHLIAAREDMVNRCASVCMACEDVLLSC